MRAKFDATDTEPLAQNSASFDALIEAGVKRWGGLIKARGIKAAT